MRIQRIENERPTPEAPVTVKVWWQRDRGAAQQPGSAEITIEKLSADEYLDKRTGRNQGSSKHGKQGGEHGKRGADPPQSKRPHKCQLTDPGGHYGSY